MLVAAVDHGHFVNDPSCMPSIPDFCAVCHRHGAYRAPGSSTTSQPPTGSYAGNRIFARSCHLPLSEQCTQLSSWLLVHRGQLRERPTIPSTSGGPGKPQSCNSLVILRLPSLAGFHLLPRYIKTVLRLFGSWTLLHDGDLFQLSGSTASRIS